MRFYALILTMLLVSNASNASDSTDRSITVSGNANETLSVTFSVGYIATKKTKIICQDFSIGAGFWVDSTKYFTYRIDNSSGSYSITLPLSELSDNTYCQWRPFIISESVALSNAPPDAKARGYSRLISIDQMKGVATTHIDLHCRNSFPLAQVGMPTHWITCIEQDKVPSLRKTITPEQRLLTVNFKHVTE
jgi:hypothetical protein